MPSSSELCSTETFDYADTFQSVIISVNQVLDEYLVEQYPEQLWQSIRYGVLNGGKRLRAVLVIESAMACSNQAPAAVMQAVLPTASAIELIHAQSLIHDDLPCMDNDDLRRGKPTVHKAFGESTAVLTGDAMIAMAFAWIARKTQSVSTETLLETIADLGEVASMQGLVNGQFVDIETEGKPYDAKTLDYIHANKTGALFGFATRAGARLIGATPEVVNHFSDFGKTLGLAFQVVDDLLDIYSTPEVLGKSIGKDTEQQKATYPDLYGEAAARQKANDLIAEAQQTLAQTGLPSGRLTRLLQLAAFIGHRIH